MHNFIYFGEKPEGVVAAIGATAGIAVGVANEAACRTARLLRPLPYLQTLREAVTKPRPLTARTEAGATTSAIPVAGSTDFFAGVGAGAWGRL